jgi:hypothetical protein
MTLHTVRRTGDVTDRPASFLANTLLWTAEKREQTGERVVVDDELRLQVVARDNVAHGSKRRRLDRWTRIEQQLHQATADTGFNDGLNLLVRTVRQVTQSPTCVREDFFVGTKDKLCECWQGRADQFKVWLGFATAKV